MGSFCRLVGWLVVWMDGLSVENFQTKKTTGAYCEPALVVLFLPYVDTVWGPFKERK